MSTPAGERLRNGFVGLGTSPSFSGSIDFGVLCGVVGVGRKSPRNLS